MARPAKSRIQGKSKGPNAKRTRPKPKRPNKAKRVARRGGVGGPQWRDASDVPGAEVRSIQPMNARKAYVCPGCQQIIPPGMGHLVVVPPDDVDLRRHWHRGCWANRRR